MVTVQIMPCYGPGPDLSLTPIVVVTVAQHGKVVATIRVQDTRLQPTYRLELPAGEYQIHGSKWREGSVRVLSGRTTTADLPGVSCL